MKTHVLILMIAGLLGLVFASAAVGQEADPLLAPGTTVPFSVDGERSAAFSVDLAEDGFAEFKWTASDDSDIFFEIADSSGKVEQKGDSGWLKSAYFVAPKPGVYTIKLFLDPRAKEKKAQSGTLTYANTFTMPPRGKVKASRNVAGYKVELVDVPDTDNTPGDSFVIVKKGSVMKNILHSDFSSPIMGYSFSGSVEKNAPASEKRVAALINNTLDKTGDGNPDVMLEYYSGGAHCCTTYYFIELPKSGPVAIREVDTGNAGMVPIGKAPNGGLRFETNENAFAYWNMSFAGSPMPSVILEFKNGVAEPNFAAMKKPAPTMAVLKRKAAAARKKISNAPYTEESMDFEDAFWSEMIDLIYTGHEDLTWKYFDMVWPKTKPGKEKFLADFKATLANGYYGSR